MAKSAKFDRGMDMFNEIKLIVIMYHMACFSGLVPNPEDQYKIGYSCLAVLLLGTAVNFFQLVVPPIRNFKKWLFLNKHKRKIRKAKAQRDNKKYATEFHKRREEDKVRQGEELEIWFEIYSKEIERYRMKQIQIQLEMEENKRQHV